VIQRWRPTRVTGLEVWNHPIPTATGMLPAYQALQVPALRQLTVETVHHARGGGSLWLAGGGAKSVFHVVPEYVHIPSGPQFAAHRGGHAWLRSHGQDGLVVDVGQTSIKLSTADGRRATIDRPAHFPAVTVADAPPSNPVELGNHAKRWLKQLLGTWPAKGIVLALPCEVYDNLRLGNSTWAGWQGTYAHGMVPTSFDNIWVINDAELAAVTARDELGPCLVLTVGFALGGARVHG
jgi:hypothetical protein